MKRFPIFCCLVLLLNVLCPVGHVHAEDVTTPTDLCIHQYGYWADGDDCVYGCTICHTVESISEHEWGCWGDGDDCVWGCPLCKDEAGRIEHEASCANPGVCIDCGQEGDWEISHNFSSDSPFINDGATGHHRVCQDCPATEENKHCAYCNDPTHCIICDYEGPIGWIIHDTGEWQSFGTEGCGTKCKNCDHRNLFPHDAYCDDPTHCIHCDYEGEITSLYHTFGSKGFNENEHWYICSLCGEKYSVGEHLNNCDDPTHCSWCDYAGENITLYHSRSGALEGFDDNQHWYTCTQCKKLIKVEHKWGDPITVEPTCSTDGSITYACTTNTCYATKVEILPATDDHDYSCWADGDDCVFGCLTCKEEFLRTYHEASCAYPNCCRYCGQEGDWHLIHKYGRWADGDDCVYGCLTCKKEDFRTYHEASCAHPGYCKYCGQEGDWSLTHNFNYYDEDLIVSDGAEGHHYVCRDCDAISTSLHFAYCDDPTHCIYCGYEGEIAFVEHSYGGYDFDENAHWRTCAQCGQKNTRIHIAYCNDPTHCCYCDYEGPIADIRHETNTYVSSGAEGHTITCLHCGNVELDEHYADCDKPNLCTICGYEGEIAHLDHFYAGYAEGDETKHWYVCFSCGVTVTAEHFGGECGVESSCALCGKHYVQEHIWDDPVTANGVKTYVCTQCGATKEERLHTHTWGDPATVDPTCTEEGSTTYTCACGKTKVETIAALGHSYGACIPTGSGAHAQTCTVCDSTLATVCTLVDTKIGNLDASACIYCGYITWKLDDTNGKQESKAVENVTFEMTDETGAAVETNNLSLVVYESTPEVTIQLDTGANVVVKKALTITVQEDSAPVKLTSTVKLSIPMEDDLTGLKLLVVDENGELVEIEYEIIDGVMVFETNILGIFMLVEEI